MFVLRLATEVNWESELKCFETFAMEVARFYALRFPEFETPSTDEKPVRIYGCTTDCPNIVLYFYGVSKWTNFSGL